MLALHVLKISSGRPRAGYGVSRLAHPTLLLGRAVDPCRHLATNYLPSTSQVAESLLPRAGLRHPQDSFMNRIFI